MGNCLISLYSTTDCNKTSIHDNSYYELNMEQQICQFKNLTLTIVFCEHYYNNRGVNVFIM